MSSLETHHISQPMKKHQVSANVDFYLPVGYDDFKKPSIYFTKVV